MDLKKELKKLENIFFKDEIKSKKISKEIRRKVEKKIIGLNKKIPETILLNEFEMEVSLYDLIKEKKTLIFFSGGSWCPYSDLNIKYLMSYSGVLKKKGYEIIVISKDMPSTNVTVYERAKLPISILSDVKSQLIEAMNITYKLPLEVKDYSNKTESFSDLEGNKEVIFPTLFIVNKKMEIERAIISEDKLYIKFIDKIINEDEKVEIRV